jgi:hypothetical protein
MLAHPGTPVFKLSSREESCSHWHWQAYYWLRSGLKCPGPGVPLGLLPLTLGKCRILSTELQVPLSELRLPVPVTEAARKATSVLPTASGALAESSLAYYSCTQASWPPAAASRMRTRTAGVPGHYHDVTTSRRRNQRQDPGHRDTSEPRPSCFESSFQVQRLIIMILPTVALDAGTTRFGPKARAAAARALLSSHGSHDLQEMVGQRPGRRVL